MSGPATTSTARAGPSSVPESKEEADWKSFVPCGVKFLPNTEELILHYLKPAKDENFIFPPGTVTRGNVYGLSPLDLLRIGIPHHEDRMYFITPVARTAGEDWREVEGVGTWRMIGEKTRLVMKDGTVAWKKNFEFAWKDYRVLRDRILMNEYVTGEEDGIALCCFYLGQRTHYLPLGTHDPPF